MIDTAMKRFSMLNMASGPVFPRLFEPDGAVDADDRAFLLGLYGGNAFDAPTVAPSIEYCISVSGASRYGVSLQSDPRYGVTDDSRSRYGVKA